MSNCSAALPLALSPPRYGLARALVDEALAAHAADLARDAARAAAAGGTWRCEGRALPVVRVLEGEARVAVQVHFTVTSGAVDVE